MAGKRLGVRAAALVAAALMVSALAAPAAYADDAVIDPNAPVATDSIVADVPTPDPSAPTGVEVGGTDPGTDVVDQTPPVSTPEPSPSDSTAPDPQPDPVTPVAPAPLAEESPVVPSPAPSAPEPLAGSSDVAPPWVPQTVTTLYPIECSVDGKDVIIGADLAGAEGEERGDIIVDGEPKVSGLLLKGPGVHTYTYDVWRTAYPEDRRVITKTFTVELCPIPSAQVTSIVASAVDAGTRSVPTSGTVSLTNVTDTNTVLVVVSDDKGHTSAPITIGADGSYLATLTGTFPDGATTVTAQANLLVDGTLVPTGTPMSTTVEFSTVVPLVASASVSAETDATCAADSTVSFAIENAVWADNGPDLTPGTHIRVAVAHEGATFADGERTKTVQYTIDGKLPEQSTDPNGACYKAPVVIPPTEEPKPPVVTPPTEQPTPTEPAAPVTQPVDAGDHKVPSKVETDGDSSPLVWTAGLAILLALASVGGALTAVRRRSVSQ